LRAFRAVLRPDGRTAFFTIQPEAGLSAGELERAVAAGPPQVSVEGDHPTMLTDAGFTDIEAVDVTAAYHETQLAWHDRWAARKDDIVEVVGEQLYDERQAERRSTLAALEEGLLRRTLYLARAR
jgi:hypothetical protein